jgi:hypothetical protein
VEEKECLEPVDGLRATPIPHPVSLPNTSTTLSCLARSCRQHRPKHTRQAGARAGRDIYSATCGLLSPNHSVSVRRLLFISTHISPSAPRRPSSLHPSHWHRSSRPYKRLVSTIASETVAAICCSTLRPSWVSENPPSLHSPAYPQTRRPGPLPPIPTSVIIISMFIKRLGLAINDGRPASLQDQ